MKFSIAKKDLQKNIQNLYNIVPTHNTMPILMNYLIEADEENNKILFTVTDLEITVVSEFDAKVMESGKIAVLAKNLNDIINSLPNSIIHFYREEEKVHINCEHSNFFLFCADVNQFPIIPDKDLKNSLEFEANLFKKMIANTHFAVSSDVNKRIYTGIKWDITPEEQSMLAADGKRIAEFRINKNYDVEKKIERIVPIKGLNFLIKAINKDSDILHAKIEENRIMFHYQNYTVFSHIIEGNYPDYSEVIPSDNKNILVVNKEQLIDSIKRITFLDTIKVRIDINDKEIKLNAKNREEGEAHETISDFEYNGSPLKITFNYKYLNVMLQSLETENAKFKIGNDKEAAVLIFNNEEKEKYWARFLLMPLRTY